MAEDIHKLAILAHREIKALKETVIASAGALVRVNDLLSRIDIADKERKKNGSSD